MRLGQVIGTVTLHTAEPALSGGRLLLVKPLVRARFADPAAPDPAPAAAWVVYDRLGAARGQLVGVVEGAEATLPFEHPIAIDALCTALIDQLHYSPP